MIKTVAFILALLVGVQCAPGLTLGSLKVPVVDNVGTDDGANVSLKNGELEVSKHSETYSEKNNHDEEKTSEDTKSYSKDGTSAHMSEDHKETSRSRNSHESRKDTHDTGFKVGKGGFNMFDNKKTTEDRTVTDKESGQTSSVHKDRDGDSAHYDESGSEYNKESRTHDHKEIEENNGFSLGGDGTGTTTNERKSSQTHEATTHEDGKSWEESKDITKDYDKTKVSSTRKDSNYAKDTAEASSSSTHEKETKTEQGNGRQAKEPPALFSSLFG